MPSTLKKIIIISGALSLILLISISFGLCFGSTVGGFKSIWESITGQPQSDPVMVMIIWEHRLPRVMMGVLAGATLSLGGLVFQALLRNSLAEPYILGISGGAAIGAIIGINLDLSYFPGVSLCAFSGSLLTLFFVVVTSSGGASLKKDSMILSGVMVNAFCSAVIMFLISLTKDSKIHNIMFWLMGDLASTENSQVLLLLSLLTPCFIILFLLSHYMNLLLMGKEMAQSMGVNVNVITFILLLVTSFMVSAIVCYCGLIGFVGLVTPHILRMILGPDHRILVPATIVGGGAYLVICDLLARAIPEQGEMPVGVITAMIGAPVFVFLLKKVR